MIQSGNDLFDSCVGMVHKYALEYLPLATTECLDDLKQEGFVALHQCSLGFKPELGVRFSTYAYRAIRNAMLRFARRDRAVTSPVNKPMSLTPGIDHLDGMETWGAERRMSQSHYSRKRAHYSHGDRAMDRITEAELRDCILSLIDERLARIFLAVNGIGEPQRNLREIAKEFGVTHQRIAQLQKIAKKQLTMLAKMAAGGDHERARLSGLYEREDAAGGRTPGRRTARLPKTA